MGNKAATQGNMSPQMKTGTRSYNRSLSAPCVVKRSISKADITFHVGEEPDTWRIPAEKTVLAQANPVFYAMFVGPLAEAQATTVQVPDVDGRGFEHLINFLYDEPVKFRSVVTALATLHASQKYLCSSLTEGCVQYLSQNLTIQNALMILQHVMIYASTADCITTEVTSYSLPTLPLDEKPLPSAPPMAATESDLDHVAAAKKSLHQPAQSHFRKRGLSDSCENLLHPPPPLQPETNGINWCALLARQTFEFIDSHGSAILVSEEFEDLPKHILETIVARDSLDVREVEVLDALIRWASCECKRRKLEETIANRRLVLGDLIWRVRFLTMDAEQFLVGPVASGLLTVDEHLPLINYLQGHLDQSQLSDVLQQQMPELASKRRLKAEPSIPSLPASSPSPNSADPSRSIHFQSKLPDSLNLDDSIPRSRAKNPRMMEKFFVCLACIFE